MTDGTQLVSVESGEWSGVDGSNRVPLAHDAELDGSTREYITNGRFASRDGVKAREGREVHAEKLHIARKERDADDATGADSSPVAERRERGGESDCPTGEVVRPAQVLLTPQLHV